MNFPGKILFFFTFISLSIPSYGEGNSLTFFEKNFESYMEQLNHARTQSQDKIDSIHNFKLFLEIVNQDLYNHSNSDFLAIPYGRSLQYTKANVKNPRLISYIGERTATNLHLGQPKIFIGFVPKENQLEVISQQTGTGHYKALIVENFGPGMSPKIIVPRQELCLKCHQNNMGPIFSRNPWKEIKTSFQPGISNEVSNYNQIRIDLGLNPIQGGTDSAFTFDQIVRSTNRKIQARRVCDEICGENIDCKKHLLALGITSGELNSPENNQLARALNSSFAKLVKTDWPKDGYAYPSSVLLDPLDETKSDSTFVLSAAPNVEATNVLEDLVLALGSLLGGLDIFLKQAIFSGENINYLESYSTAVPSRVASFQPSIQGTTVHGLVARRFLDPRNPRPLVSSIPLGKAAEILNRSAGVCFHIEEQQRNRLNKIDIKKRINWALNSQSSQSLLNAKDLPHFSNQMVERLYSEIDRYPELQLNQLTPIESAERFVEKISEVPQWSLPKLFDDKYVDFLLQGKSMPESQVLENFQYYCSTCHSGNFYGVPEISFESFELISQFRNGAAEWHLRNQSMPDPLFIPGIDKPSEIERAFMIKYLRDIN